MKIPHNNGIRQTSKMKLTSDLTKSTTKAKLTEFGVSMPVQLVKRLDDMRGDVPRSRFLLRLVEQELEKQEEQEVEEKLQQGTQVGSHRRFTTASQQLTTANKGGGSCSNG
jgi:metal-responsive CopG/Arc/MetJ family transcriptional regulator